MSTDQLLQRKVKSGMTICVERVQAYYSCRWLMMLRSTSVSSHASTH